MSDPRELTKKVEDLLQVYESQYPGEAPEKIAAYRTAAETYLKLRLPARAAPIYERMLAILRATESRPSLDRLATLDALSTTYAACGRHRDGLALIEEAIAILKQYFPDRSADLYSAMNNLASMHLGLEQYDDAERIFLESLSLSDTVLKARKESIAATHHQLGALYFQRGDYLRAEKSLSLALELKKQLFGDEHPQVGMTLNNLAALYTLLGHPDASVMAQAAQRMLAPAARTPQPAATRIARAVSLRCLDPGDRAVELLGAFIEELKRAGFIVERVFTVAEHDIYDEGILPPIVTVYFHQGDLVGAPNLAPLAESLAATVARFRAAGITGYGSGEHKSTNDAAVFVTWDDNATVRYYFMGDGYLPTAFAAIPLTLGNVAPRIQRTGHSLSNIVLWKDEHWRWLQPGSGDNRVD
jgi:tetratricopeptide (TPR) repeat protein